jgi:hypothetical protein
MGLWHAFTLLWQQNGRLKSGLQNTVSRELVDAGCAPLLSCHSLSVRLKHLSLGLNGDATFSSVLSGSS